MHRMSWWFWRGLKGNKRLEVLETLRRSRMASMVTVIAYRKSIEKRLELERERDALLEVGCLCSPGDQCSCPYDCDCRVRNAHTHYEDAGWINEGPGREGGR